MAKKKARPNVYKYYAEGDFSYEMSFLNEYYSSEVKFKIILYRLDIIKSKTTNIYGESKAKDKKFLPPVELSIAMNGYVVEQNFLTKGGLFNENISEFNFSVLMSELTDKNVVINEGDFLKFNDGQLERNFEITKYTNINSDNTAYGFKPYFTLISCKLAKDNIVLI